MRPEHVWISEGGAWHAFHSESWHAARNRSSVVLFLRSKQALVDAARDLRHPSVRRRNFVSSESVVWAICVLSFLAASGGQQGHEEGNCARRLYFSSAASA